MVADFLDEFGILRLLFDECLQLGGHDNSIKQVG